MNGEQGSALPLLDESWQRLDLLYLPVFEDLLGHVDILQKSLLFARVILIVRAIGRGETVGEVRRCRRFRWTLQVFRLIIVGADGRLKRMNVCRHADAVDVQPERWWHRRMRLFDKHFRWCSSSRWEAPEFGKCL